MMLAYEVTDYNEIFYTKIYSNKLLEGANRGVWYSANRVRERYSISKKTDFNFPNMALLSSFRKSGNEFGFDI